MSLVANAAESPSNAKPAGGNLRELVFATVGAGLNRDTNGVSIPGISKNASAVKAGGLPMTQDHASLIYRLAGAP